VGKLFCGLATLSSAKEVARELAPALPGPLPRTSKGINRFANGGGVQGRRIQRGDELSVQQPQGTNRSSSWAVRPEVLVEYYNPFLLRVLECPQSKLFGIGTKQQFLAAEFTISTDSNRMGYRLEGPRLVAPDRELISEATPAGAIQVLPNGEALLLMADRQTVGGYPKIAVLISADLPKAAQLGPDDPRDLKRYLWLRPIGHSFSRRSA
jgi:antagonist of KipI